MADTKSCYQCRAALKGEDPVCPRCGWDGVRGRRCCLSCGGWIGLTSSVPGQGASSGLVSLFVGLTAGLLAGCLGGLAAGLALAAAGCLVAGLTLRYGCAKCGREPAPYSLSQADRDDHRGRRMSLLLASGGMGAGAVVAMAIWLFVVLWAGGVHLPEGEGELPDLDWMATQGRSGNPIYLVEALDDDRVAEKVSQLLVELGPPAVKQVAGALKHHKPKIPSRAAGTLRQMGPAAGEAVPELIKALEEDLLREVAADALAAIGEAAVPALAGALKHPLISVRSSAVSALGRIPGDIAAAQDGLVECTRDFDEQVRLMSVRLLGARGGRHGVPALRASLKDAVPEVRKAAVDALGALGPDAVAAVADLEAILSDADRDLGARARAALEKITGRR